MTRLGVIHPQFSPGRREKKHVRRRCQEFATGIIMAIITNSLAGTTMAQVGCMAPCICNPDVPVPTVNAKEMEGIWLLAAESPTDIFFSDKSVLCQGLSVEAKNLKLFLMYRDGSSTNVLMDFLNAHTTDNVTWQILPEPLRNAKGVMGYYMHVRSYDAKVMVFYRCYPGGTKNSFSWTAVYTRKPGSLPADEIMKHMDPYQPNNSFYAVRMYSNTECDL